MFMNSLVTALFQRAARKSRRWAGVKRPVGRAVPIASWVERWSHELWSLSLPCWSSLGR